MAASHAADNMYADDEYDDMEDWYSTSFPRNPASSFTTKAAISQDGDEVWVANTNKCKEERWLNGDDDLLEAVDDSGNDYEILIDEVSTSRTEIIDTIDHDYDSVMCNTEVGHAVQERDNVALQHTNQLQPVSFKRKVRVPAPLLEIGAESCDRCKSDLNRKLMVSCSKCSFRRHLYCYTPPLNKHPIFNQTKTTTRENKVKPRVSAADIPQYICTSCRENLQAIQAPRSDQPLNLSHKNERPLVSKSAVYSVARSRIISTPTDPTVEHNKATRGLKKQKLQIAPLPFKQSTNPLHYYPSRRRLDCDQNGSFDWFRYRADKQAKVILNSTSSESFEIQTKPRSELNIYSDKLALLGETATFWRRFAAKKKLVRRRHDNFVRITTRKMQAKVMCLLSPQDLENLEKTQLRKEQELAHDLAVFDDTLFYKFCDLSPDQATRLPKVTLSFQEAQNVSSVAVNCFDRDHLQQITDMDQFWGLCVEISEILSMSHEDMNIWQNDISEIDTNIEKKTSHVSTLHQATRLIQTVMLQWQWRKKEIIHLQCELQQREDEKQQRRAKASRFVKVLILCIKFIIMVFHQLRDCQVKKQLLLIIKDATEDKSVLSSIQDTVGQQKLLAEILIRRFLSRKVQPHISHRKTVMAKRIQQFWKRILLQWKWRERAVASRNLHRYQACLRIQKLFRRFRTKMIFQKLTRENAIMRARRFLRCWLFRRIIKKKKLQMDIYESVVGLRISSDLIQISPDSSVPTMIYELGMELYRLGDFWNAAWMLHQASRKDLNTLDWNGRIALAYSHHMTWYTSYDLFNLDEAHDNYCFALDSISDRTSKNAASVVDPFILQDLAIVKMHKGCFGGSLHLLAKLIEFFPHDRSFSLWVFLAAIQLQQKGDWEQSIQYLVYLQDLAPKPYLERDILSLCAINYERTNHLGSKVASKEAWKAALRLWNLEAKNCSNVTAYDKPNLKSTSVNDIRKREMLTEFATRTFQQGHYLLTCQLLVYVSTRLQIKSEGYDQRQLWWTLAETFRHLGHIDLYLNAFTRFSDLSSQVDQKRWVEDQSSNFQQEITRLSILEKLRILSLQYISRQ